MNRILRLTIVDVTSNTIVIITVSSFLVLLRMLVWLLTFVLLARPGPLRRVTCELCKSSCMVHKACLGF